MRIRASTLLWADILVKYAFFDMQNYLTNVWKLSLTHAAGILNIWGGIRRVLPAFFLFLVDAFLGNFKMLVVSSTTYSVGILLVTLSTPPALANSTGKCKQYEPQCIGHTHKVLFYTGMALIAVGIAGNLVSLQRFLQEQTQTPNTEGGNPNTPNCEGNAQSAGEEMCSLKQIGLIMVVVVPLVGAIALPYIKPWFIRFLIPTICTLAATCFFFSAWCSYKDVAVSGSPITNVCKVFVASCLKLSTPLPPDGANEYYKRNCETRQLFTPTRLLRFLQKAAIILPGRVPDEQVKKWRLSSVAEVEDAKIAVRMVPMWMTFIFCGIVSSIGNTYFVKQANHLNRNWGKWKLPLQVLLLFYDSAKNLFGIYATKLLACRGKRVPAIGIAVAMIFSILCCIAAAATEKMRLSVIRRHDLLDKPDKDIPMSMYWLLFQFLLLAGLDSFYEKSVAAFYNDQAPPSMKNYLEYFSKGVSGLGFMCSVLSVCVVGKISEKGGRPNWFQYTLNKSRLDRYYRVLAALSSINLVVFVAVAVCYRYRERRPQGNGEGGNVDEHGNGDEEGNQDEGLPFCGCC